MVDRRTPPGLAMQLSLLRAPGDRVVSVGAPPWGLDAIHLRLNTVRTLLPGWAKLLGGASDGTGAVHAWSTGPASLAGRVLADRLGVPFCLSVASAADLGRESCYAPGAIASATRITAPTRWDVDALAGEGRDPSRLCVLPPAAAPVDDREALRRDARARLQLGDDDRLLVCPLPLTREAGYRLAAWIRGVLWMAGHRLEMLLPTPGDDRAQAEYFLRTSSPGGRIILPDEWSALCSDRPATQADEPANQTEAARLMEADRTPEATSRAHSGAPSRAHQALQAALSAADVAMLCPARSFGGTWLTACLAAGVPVVASPLGAHAELAPHGESALLSVSPGGPRDGAAAILSLLEESQLAESLIGRGLARARAAHHPDRSRDTLQRAGLPGRTDSALTAVRVRGV